MRRGRWQYLDWVVVNGIVNDGTSHSIDLIETGLDNFSFFVDGQYIFPGQRFSVDTIPGIKLIVFVIQVLFVVQSVSFFMFFLFARIELDALLENIDEFLRAWSMEPVVNYDVSLCLELVLVVDEFLFEDLFLLGTVWGRCWHLVIFINFLGIRNG